MDPKAGNRSKSPGKDLPANGELGVTPAQAGIHAGQKHRSHIHLAWIPAFAGTTLRNRLQDQVPGLLLLLQKLALSFCFTVHLYRKAASRFSGHTLAIAEFQPQMPGQIGVDFIDAVRFAHDVIHPRIQ